jgi:soluble lytic murein transglycosylase-like protein
VESRFARFDTPGNGIRALGKLLLNYQTRYGLKTVAAIIARWAPSTENDTAAYVLSVETSIPGLPHGAAVDLTNPLVLGAFVRAIIAHENGGNPYADSVVDEGVRRALA